MRNLTNSGQLTRSTGRDLQGRTVGHLAYLALAAGILVWLTFNYRLNPWFTPDTEDYLLLAAHRPPGYGLFLNGLRLIGFGEELRFLPQLQAVALVGALAAFAHAVGRSLCSLPAGLAVLGLPWLQPVVGHATASVMTEALFLAATLGAAALCLSATPLRSRVLLGIGACLGAAFLLRTAGFAIAAAVLLFLVVVLRVGWRGLTLVLAPMFAAWLLGAAVQAQVNGRFALGSFGGVSLIGKGAFLARDDARLPEALQGLPQAAAEARDLVAAAPNWRLAERLRLQAYEDLRFKWIWPRAEAGLRGWNPQDPSSWTALSGPLAMGLIRADPAGYTRLVAQDYVALFTWPELTSRAAIVEDRDFLLARPRTLIAADCDLATAPDCWPVLPWVPALPLWRVLQVIAVLALPLSLLVLLAGATAACRLAPWPGRVLLLSALLIQAQAVATALAEGGLLRYATPLAPFITALAAAAVVWLTRRLMRRRVADLP